MRREHGDYERISSFDSLVGGPVLGDELSIPPMYPLLRLLDSGLPDDKVEDALSPTKSNSLWAYMKGQHSLDWYFYAGYT